MNIRKPVIIYLDQNKWIQIARLIHRVETDGEAFKRVEKLIWHVKEGSVLLPLSAIHFLETQRIKNAQRRKNLGNVMWSLSTGKRFISTRGLITYEIKEAIHQIIPTRPKPSLNLIGYGLEHAFGMTFDRKVSKDIEELFEKFALTGESPNGVPSSQYSSIQFKENFSNHLSRIATIDQELPNRNWKDFLSAITIIDILEPLNYVFEEYHLNASEFKSREFCETLISKMPTRVLDIHLHTQFFKNKQLRSKLTDLEDWAALGPASMYCDYVACEKHFANLINRDNFKTKAALYTDLSFIDVL